MKSTVAVVAVAVVALTLIFGLVELTGCTTPVTPTQQQIIDRNASLIDSATISVVAIGLTAIPKKEEADFIATTATKAINEEILPLLNGDETALVSGIQQILTLKAFDKPGLDKFKSIVELGLPFLRSFLPVDLIDGQLNKVRPDVKEYLVAFFTGVRDGCNAYQGKTTSRARSSQFKDLRAKLEK